uniref:Uncharacterized protein LOC111102620 n=1 Tax=Crassostrea virginica TaxID=6565 RepID=A0A8B8AKN1_CRAVI|nr:uncharacterized protein LOC111102620 [Crassostrea virginica]
MAKDGYRIAVFLVLITFPNVMSIYYCGYGEHGTCTDNEMGGHKPWTDYKIDTYRPWWLDQRQNEFSMPMTTEDYVYNQLGLQHVPFFSRGTVWQYVMCNYVERNSFNCCF